MSCGNHHDLPCIEVKPFILLYIDHEIPDHHQLDLIEVHFGECPPCKAEMEQENHALVLMRELLTRSCVEAAPQSLHERLIEQTHQLHKQLTEATQSISGYVETTETTYTEITIDGQTKIEITREIRREFPLD